VREGGGLKGRSERARKAWGNEMQEGREWQENKNDIGGNE